MAKFDPREVEWMAAVLEWCRISRPDILPKVEEMIVNDAFTLLMGAAFDAGRCFQHANPGCPLGPIMPGGDWNEVTDAVCESRAARLRARCQRRGETPGGLPCSGCGHGRDKHDEGPCKCGCEGFAL